MRYIKRILGAIVLVSVVLLFGAIGDCENGGDAMLYAGRILSTAALAVSALFAYGAIDYKERNE